MSDKSSTGEYAEDIGHTYLHCHSWIFSDGKSGPIHPSQIEDILEANGFENTYMGNKEPISPLF